MATQETRNKRSYADLVVDEPTGFRVHSSVYRDPQILEDEMRHIFEKTWVYVCHESEVSQPGDYRTTTIGRTPVIVTRSQNNALNVLLNTCRHRANAICRDASGNSTDFRCPYHGWVYTNEGDLVGVADRRRYPEDFTTKGMGLLRVPHVASYRGLVFGCLDPQVPWSLDEYLGETKKYIDLWADRCPEGEFRLLRPHRYSYRGNWKFQAENSNDGYHGGFTHESNRMTMEHFGEISSGRTRDKVSQGGIARGFDFGHGAFEGGGSRPGGMTDEVFETYRAALTKRHGDERTKEIFGARHLLLFPNVVLMTHNIRVIQPITTDETEVSSYVMAVNGVPDEVNMALLADVQRRLGTTGMIGPDDVEMFAANQNGLRAERMEWLVLNRGLGKETTLPTGERWGVGSDETPMRAIYKEWGRLMGAAGSRDGNGG
jgi:phenylpropionate dioxygenase-like ring-hydroxylating dioxygenase large terminal subunit